MLFRAALAAIGCILLVTLVLCLCSCRAKKETATEHFRDSVEFVHSAKADTLVVWKERTDSVIVRDSVFTLVKGDTVFVKEYHYRDRTNMAADVAYRASRDTVWRERTVTEYKTKTVTVTKTVKVEKPLRWWQTALMWLGGLTIATAIILLIYKKTLR